MKEKMNEWFGLKRKPSQSFIFKQEVECTQCFGTGKICGEDCGACGGKGHY